MDSGQFDDASDDEEVEPAINERNQFRKRTSAGGQAPARRGGAAATAPAPGNRTSFLLSQNARHQARVQAQQSLLYSQQSRIAAMSRPTVATQLPIRAAPQPQRTNHISPAARLQLAAMGQQQRRQQFLQHATNQELTASALRMVGNDPVQQAMVMRMAQGAATMPPAAAPPPRVQIVTGTNTGTKPMHPGMAKIQQTPDSAFPAVPNPLKGATTTAPSNPSKPAREYPPTVAPQPKKVPKAMATKAAGPKLVKTYKAAVKKSRQRSRKQAKIVKSDDRGSIVQQEKSWAHLDNSRYSSPVVCASRYIGNELQHGMWPSPFWTGDETPLVREHEHKMHMKTVAAALENFAMNVVLPSITPFSIQQEIANRVPYISPDNKLPMPKSFFATLLALREVMTQNAERIFGKLSLEDTGGGRKPKRNRIVREEEVHVARTLATGVAIAAMERCQPGHAEPTVAKFLEIVEKYDDGDEEFASCLEPDQGTVHGILPNGKRLNAQEEVARNVSFNRSRKRHPLIQRQMEKKLKIRPTQLVRVAQPDVCHIAIVEQLLDWQKHT